MTTENETINQTELTDEQREEISRAMYEQMIQQQHLQHYAPIFDTINSFFQNDEQPGKVYNLVRGADERWRCIVHNTQTISETYLDEDANISYQIFNPENENEEVLWVYYHPEHRVIIRQKGFNHEDFEIVHGSQLHEIYKGEDLSYFIGFLSDMACINNKLNDEEAVKSFAEAKAIADNIVGDDNKGIHGFIVNTLVKAGNLTNMPKSWDGATDLSEVEFLEYGVAMKANDKEITSFSNKAIFYFMTPPATDSEGNPIKLSETEKEAFVIPRTAMLNEETVPAPEANSESDFKVKLKVTENWKAAIVFTTSGLDKEVSAKMELYKRGDYNPVISNKK